MADDWVQQYLAALSQTEEFGDGWFAETIARARDGDDEARRRICGATLRWAFHIAESAHKAHPGVSLLELVQDANGTLWDMICKFTGSTVAEFRTAAATAIAHHLKQMIDRLLEPGVSGPEP